jgi:hypothetical protein
VNVVPNLEHRYGYVTGHDGLLHAVNVSGFTICGMGRQQSPRYVEKGPVSCLHCYLLPWDVR